ncbi:prolyl oligopeptidase family serine peptidase [Kineosporia succinea]|uniref:Dipeptidyl aminopeptidase/acylaminoacyl peptidase n=1 Tax=Kineosporia succinea TaxID=84632 RepID=A0ABT9P1Y8_9ACTN|nr:prolyl oligopeptidase family serine peptidase [Kineosporia succinea]MDP9826688.1 dipeptidyl aminopeptidase/acylaminoacyl peptidase [Kineosporia succinea]
MTQFEEQSSEAVPEDVYGSWSPSPSPDGQRMAFISDRGGAPAIWVKPVGAQPVRPGIALERVLSISWSPCGTWLACLVAGAGSSRDEIWVVRPDGSGLRQLAGGPGSTAWLGSGAHHGWTHDGRLMVTETVGAVASAVLISPSSGERAVITSGALVTLLDVAGGRVLLRRGPRSYRTLSVCALDGSDELTVNTSVSGERGGFADLGGLSPDGQFVYARSEADRDLAALVRVRLSSGSSELLAQRADAELQNVTLSPDGATAVLLWNEFGGTNAVSLLDLESGKEDRIEPLPRDVVDDCRLYADGTTLVLTAEDWSDPRGAWTIDLATGSTLPLTSRADGELRGSRGSSYATVDTADLTRPVLRRFAAFDGIGLSGWLYRPDSPAPWPTMIHLHGGPESQERPVYNSLFQSLVAEGVAVFAPNVRGSSGFGRTFETADDVARRLGSIRDVAASVEHLVSSGVSQADRVGLMGRSYGGYLTLAGLTWYPDLFRVGVDVCGMADLETFYRHTEPWIGAAAVSKYGSPDTDAAVLRDFSPIHRIDRLTAPLLVVHGSDDTNVPLEEAEQVVTALAERGAPHRFLQFPGEGHELLDTQNRVTFVRTTVDWACEHLGVERSLQGRA